MPNEKLQSDIERLAREFAAEVTRLVARAIVDEVEGALAGSAGTRRSARREDDAPARVSAGRPRRVQATLVERWVPDRRARRVPKFVIEATGIGTKREIVLRFGEHAIFEKGQPAPPPLRSSARSEGEG
jgi:hypothetical protein